MTLSKTAFARLLTKLLCMQGASRISCGGQLLRNLYNVSYKNNSPGRMRTVTPENQYERLQQSATPLSRLSYAKQLQIKRAALERALVKVVNIIKHNYARGAFTADMEKMVEGSQGCICPLVDMKPSPKTEEFRNKEELIISLGADGDPNTIGLIIGRGSDALCVSNDGLLNTKPVHKEVVKKFRSFLAQSKFKNGDTEGSRSRITWNKLLIRSNEQGHVMLVPDLHCGRFSQELVNQARDELTDFYGSESWLSHDLHSLYLRTRYIRSRAYLTQQHILGDTHIYEEVLGYRFRISPESFFQLNTAGAQVLYTVVQDLVKACRPKTLLDVGCGTGTIGIVMSSLVDRVIGLDVVDQAIQDAEFNAHLNGVTNATFHVGSARQLLRTFLAEGNILTDETVAVVNPSRNGLNKKAIQRLRCCEVIKHLIFISCKPHGNALINFADLIVPENEDHPGKPFQAVQAVGVDMFPQTIHSELVLLFQR